MNFIALYDINYFINTVDHPDTLLVKELLMHFEPLAIGFSILASLDISFGIRKISA